MRLDGVNDGTIKKAGKVQPGKQSPGADAGKTSDPLGEAREDAVKAGWIEGASEDPAFFIKESGV